MVKKDYEHIAHTKFIMRYHLIFSTKYRKKVLKDIIPEVKQIIQDISVKQKHWSIEMVEIDKNKPDHIHLLVRGTPETKISTVVHTLKQQTTYQLWKSHNNYLSTYYYGSAHYLWTRGYFCSTVGEVSEKTLKNYIEKQG